MYGLPGLSPLCRGLGTKDGIILDEERVLPVQTSLEQSNGTFLTRRGRMILYSKPDVKCQPCDEVRAVYTTLFQLYNGVAKVAEKQIKTDRATHLDRHCTPGKNFQEYLGYVLHNRYSTKPDSAPGGPLERTKSSIYELLPDDAYEMGYSMSEFLRGKTASKSDWLELTHRSMKLALDVDDPYAIPSLRSSQSSREYFRNIDRTALVEQKNWNALPGSEEKGSNVGVTSSSRHPVKSAGGSSATGGLAQPSAGSDADSAYFSFRVDRDTSGNIPSAVGNSRLSHRTYDTHEELEEGEEESGMEEEGASEDGLFSTKDFPRRRSSVKKRGSTSHTPVGASFDEEIESVDADEDRLAALLASHGIDSKRLASFDKRNASPEDRTTEWLRSTNNVMGSAGADERRRSITHMLESLGKHENASTSRLTDGAEPQSKLQPTRVKKTIVLTPIVPPPSVPAENKESTIAPVPVPPPALTKVRKVSSAKGSSNIPAATTLQQKKTTTTTTTAITPKKPPKESRPTSITVGGGSSRLQMAKEKSAAKRDELEREGVKASVEPPPPTTATVQLTVAELVAKALQDDIKKEPVAVETPKAPVPLPPLPPQQQQLQFKSPVKKRLQFQGTGKGVEEQPAPAAATVEPKKRYDLEEDDGADGDSPYSRLRQLHSESMTEEPTMGESLLQSPTAETKPTRRVVQKKTRSNLARPLPPRIQKDASSDYEDEFDEDVIRKRRQKAAKAAAAAAAAEAPPPPPPSLLEKVLKDIQQTEATAAGAGDEEAAKIKAIDEEMARRALELAAEHARLEEERVQAEEKARREREEQLASVRELQAKLQEAAAERIRKEKEAEQQKKDMQDELAAIAEEERQAKLLEDEAKKEIAQSRKDAREERERRRQRDLEEKKKALERRKQAEIERLQAAMEREREMMEALHLSEAEMQKWREEKQRRRAELDAKYFGLMEDEEIWMDQRREDEEDALRDAEAAAEEEALNRLREERLAAEDAHRRLQEQLHRMRRQEEEERLQHLEELRRMEEEKARREEEEKRIEEEKQRALEEWKRQEEEFFRKAQAELEARQAELARRQDHNLQFRTGLAQSKQKLKISKPWVFSYLINWKDHYVERSIPQSSGQKGGARRAQSVGKRK